ncbi:maleylpyruvate isomerase N-terminal domain-containing protein [Streptomyces sp. Isolate_219]|uniref:maleylpyruvate isomerase N-terminal domain-containing protein n=1 Tax=Streptomyces sp. Isolate_219 TaxID=2950110 RepID=UPI0021C7C21A|nr:maleylpyruvate isomerase N-terminal domain-containing protein [Streptomyces sp. Isolate_219]MCR8579763.1 maleylpyruvate isomerase N-terminal domain-containing protein [Streptomyces sp. Isolate_219]
MENETARKRKKAEVRAAIAAERRELAELFDTLRTDQWNEQSLCAGWRVREVVAHMTMGSASPCPRRSASWPRRAATFTA